MHGLCLTLPKPSCPTPVLRAKFVEKNASGYVVLVKKVEYLRSNTTSIPTNERVLLRTDNTTVLPDELVDRCRCPTQKRRLAYLVAGRIHHKTGSLIFGSKSMVFMHDVFFARQLIEILMKSCPASKNSGQHHRRQALRPTAASKILLSTRGPGQAGAGGANEEWHGFDTTAVPTDFWTEITPTLEMD